MKSGVYDKQIPKENKANNYYDSNDPWIDDGYTEKFRGQRMELPAAKYEDFISVFGNIEQFYSSEEYNLKLATISEFTEKNKQNEEKLLLEQKKNK